MITQQLGFHDDNATPFILPTPQHSHN